MAYKQKSSPFNHVNSWEEEDVKRGRKLEKEGKKGHAEALFIDAHDSNRWRGGNDGSEPMHAESRYLSEGGDVIDETAQRSGSFMSKHTQSSLNYGSPLHAAMGGDASEKTGDELKKEGKDLKKEGRDLKKEGRQKKRKKRQAERKVKSGERQLKRNLAANQKQIDKDAKSKELTVDPIDDGNIGNVTGKRSVTKTKTVSKKDGKRTVKKTKTVTR
jgi:hypothetical protein